MVCVKKSTRLSAMFRPFARWCKSYLQPNQLGRISSEPDDIHGQAAQTPRKWTERELEKGKAKWGVENRGVTENKTIQLSDLRRQWTKLEWQKRRSRTQQKTRRMRKEAEVTGRKGFFRPLDKHVNHVTLTDTHTHTQCWSEI